MIEGKCRSGLGFAVRRSGNAVGYCALSIRCGTRDEARFVDGKRDRQGFHSGVAHFTEHMIFKGTEHKNASVINGYLDRLGGELNAYTTKEEIVIHATVLKEDLGKAASLLLEMATCPTFPESELELERGVIIDEINSYKDTPSEEVYDMFEEMLFEGHPLSGPILGSIRSVKQVTSEELARFVREKFRPENMAFTVVADVDERKLSQLVEKLSDKFFGAAGGPGAAARSAVCDGVLDAAAGAAACDDQLSGGDSRSAGAPQHREPFKTTVNRHNHQVNCIVGGCAPSLYDGHDRIVTVLLANILGGPASNSILNSVLREKKGLVYGVECSYTQYADTGIIAIGLGCDKTNIDKCLKIIDKELLKLQEDCLSERRLKAAVKQLLGQLAVSGDNGETQCLSMGKSLLSYGHVFTDEESRRQIESVTAEDLRRLSALLFSPDNLSTLILV